MGMSPSNPKWWPANSVTITRGSFGCTLISMNADLISLFTNTTFACGNFLLNAIILRPDSLTVGSSTGYTWEVPKYKFSLSRSAIKSFSVLQERYGFLFNTRVDGEDAIRDSSPPASDAPRAKIRPLQMSGHSF